MKILGWVTQNFGNFRLKKKPIDDNDDDDRFDPKSKKGSKN